MKNLLLLCCLFVVNLLHGQSSKNKQYLLVGTYTSGKSEGIYVYEFNTQNADFKQISICKGIKNPSFFSVAPNQKYVYSVGEIEKNGVINSFRFDKKTGQLVLLNTVSSEGSNPCYVNVDKTGKYVLVGNYSSGNLSVSKILGDGKLSSSIQKIQHTGHGTNVSRQEQAHVHSVNISPNNQDVFVADLGIDKIMNYKLDSKTGLLSPSKTPFNKIDDGAGPRHFEFHPKGKFAYLLQELTGMVTAFDYSDGQLRPKQTISALPKDFKGDFSCADIHASPDGLFLYASVRGHNTLAIYKINQENGLLTYLDNQSVIGKNPRNFMIDPTGNFVLVANQETDNITIFKRDKTTGLLTSTGKEISVPTPVCLKMIAF